MQIYYTGSKPQLNHAVCNLSAPDKILFRNSTAFQQQYRMPYRVIDIALAPRRSLAIRTSHQLLTPAAQRRKLSNSL